MPHSGHVGALAVSRDIVLGIDVGTTFSAAAVWREGWAETVPFGNDDTVWIANSGDHTVSRIDPASTP